MPEGHIEDDREILTPSRIADELRVSARTVYRWIESGKLKATRLPSGQYRIYRSDLDAALTVLEAEPDSHESAPRSIAELSAKLDRLLDAGNSERRADVERLAAERAEASA